MDEAFDTVTSVEVNPSTLRLFASHLSRTMPEMLNVSELLVGAAGWVEQLVDQSNRVGNRYNSLLSSFDEVDDENNKLSARVGELEAELIKLHAEIAQLKAQPAKPKTAAKKNG